MKQLFFIILCGLGLMACSSAKKPELEPTQIVNGKSIVMPPDFYLLPKAQKSSDGALPQTTDSKSTKTE